MLGHQPKELTELAFASFTTYMKEQALQFLKWMEVPLPCSELETKSSETCRELKDVFHGTRLPSVLANKITKQLLIKLDMFSEIYESTRKEYFQQILLPLVEVFIHPDVTSIELDPGYFNESDYQYIEFILTLILVIVGTIHNLKTLSVELRMYNSLEDIKLVLPAQLKEFTLSGCMSCSNDNLKGIFECCRELKSFKTSVNFVSDIIVPHLLKLNRLETLHLLGEDRRGYVSGLNATFVALINGLSTNATSDVLSASTLKSFGITVKHENALHLIVDKLPHLTEIVLELPCKLDLSCLTQLKNLRSLTLDAKGRKSDDYKKILPVLGKNLVFLDLRGYWSLDLEFIGETCSNLRCLYLCTAGGFETPANSSLKSFPNFRTVERLRVNMYQDYGGTKFIIFQCVNVKVLSAVLRFERTVIENILISASLTSLEEIHFCPELRIDNTFLEALCLRCPNLRLVHGLGSDSFISGRVVFDSHGCRESLCELYGLTLDGIVTYFRDEDDDSIFVNCYTSDSEEYNTSDSEDYNTSDSEST